MTGVGSIDAVVRKCDVLLSVCPPDAALTVARSVAGFGGVYVDANAIAPTTAKAVAQVVTGAGARYVDGAIVGPPPGPASTRLLLSGDDAPAIAELFDATAVDAAVLTEGPYAPSALKMAYAAWTKGSGALLLACHDVATRSGVGALLEQEWARSQPGALSRLPRADVDRAEKGWRWSGEMREIAATFASVGAPAGFAEAAAVVYESR